MLINKTVLLCYFLLILNVCNININYNQQIPRTRDQLRDYLQRHPNLLLPPYPQQNPNYIDPFLDKKKLTPDDNKQPDKKEENEKDNKN